MKEFLESMKLIDYQTTTLQISKTEFARRLAIITVEGSTSFVSNAFEPFSSGNQEFKGQINEDGFKLRRRRRFFDTNMNMAVAKGIVSENDGHLIVETEINGFNNFFIFYYLLIIGFYSVIIVVIGSNAEMDFIAILFITIHGFFMLGIPYFIMRRSVSRMKHELEREFFYLTKNS